MANKGYSLTWEEAVVWLRGQADKQLLVRDCYFDDPLEASAERFNLSEEAAELRHWVSTHPRGELLDLGAGRGISSYAFAKLGFAVTALEPDPSALVGAEAIEKLAANSGLPIKVVREFSENLPFANDSFDVVYARAALHHARDLKQLCREAFRVMKPGGIFIATREHVISSKGDLRSFFEGHALHFLYGGENAYLLSEYLSAIRGAGFQLTSALGPFETVVNYYPLSIAGFQSMVETQLCRKFPPGLSRRLAKSALVRNMMGRRLSRTSEYPGRHYSFRAEKR